MRKRELCRNGREREDLVHPFISHLHRFYAQVPIFNLDLNQELLEGPDLQTCAWLWLVAVEISELTNSPMRFSPGFDWFELIELLFWNQIDLERKVDLGQGGKDGWKNHPHALDFQPSGHHVISGWCGVVIFMAVAKWNLFNMLRMRHVGKPELLVRLFRPNRSCKNDVANQPNSFSPLSLRSSSAGIFRARPGHSRLPRILL